MLMYRLLNVSVYICINMDLLIRRFNVKGVNFWNRIELLGLLFLKIWIKNMKIFIILL